MTRRAKPHVEARRREAFLDALRGGLSVTGALAVAGLARSTAFDHKRDEPEFRAQWEAAVDEGTDLIEDEAKRRAVEGTPEYVVSQGRIVRGDDGVPLTVRKYSDNLMAILLRARSPSKYRERVSAEISGPNGGPIETAEVSPADRIRLRIADIAARRPATAEDEAPVTVVEAQRLFD